VIASPSEAGYAVKLQTKGFETRTLIAFTDELSEHAASVTANQPSSWNSSENGADMVIVTHNHFRQAIEPLAALRRGQGLNVAIVDIDDVYDEFSYGTHTPWPSRVSCRGLQAIGGARLDICCSSVIAVTIRATIWTRAQTTSCRRSCWIRPSWKQAQTTGLQTSLAIVLQTWL
jgi:hypothetical protein